MQTPPKPKSTKAKLQTISKQLLLSQTICYAVCQIERYDWRKTYILNKAPNLIELVKTKSLQGKVLLLAHCTPFQASSTTAQEKQCSLWKDFHSEMPSKIM